jgi:hypothetical protein
MPADPAITAFVPPHMTAGKSRARFIFFTKTSWREPPRLRHQLARLLATSGHDVAFFQKPRYPWEKGLPAVDAEGSISFYRHQELIHHKLRVSPAVARANAYWVKTTISRASASLQFNEDDVVVNFNYDYYFLRDIFKKNRLLTVINDNFISRALFGFEKPLLGALQSTCESSDSVLTTSSALQVQLGRYCKPQLFWPWADREYRRPVTNSIRDTLLAWGYINRKIDFEFVVKLADTLRYLNSSIRILFVGPAESNQGDVELLRSRPNIEFLAATSLDKLPLERVIAGFIPCRSDDPEIDAIELPNRALQLLARGLPLLITGMPHFVAAPFVFRVATDSCLQDISRVQAQFGNLQPGIEEFVSRHSAQARLDQFLSLVS